MSNITIITYPTEFFGFTDSSRAIAIEFKKEGMLTEEITLEKRNNLTINSEQLKSIINNVILKTKNTNKDIIITGGPYGVEILKLLFQSYQNGQPINCKIIFSNHEYSEEINNLINIKGFDAFIKKNIILSFPKYIELFINQKLDQQKYNIIFNKIAYTFSVPSTINEQIVEEQANNFLQANSKNEKYFQLISKNIDGIYAFGGVCPNYKSYQAFLNIEAERRADLLIEEFKNKTNILVTTHGLRSFQKINLDDSKENNNLEGFNKFLHKIILLSQQKENQNKHIYIFGKRKENDKIIESFFEINNGKIILTLDSNNKEAYKFALNLKAKRKELKFVATEDQAGAISEIENLKALKNFKLQDFGDVTNESHKALTKLYEDNLKRIAKLSQAEQKLELLKTKTSAETIVDFYKKIETIK